MERNTAQAVRNVSNKSVRLISVDVMYYIADIEVHYEHISTYWTYPEYTTQFTSPFNEVVVSVNSNSRVTVASHDTGLDTWKSTGYEHRLVNKPGVNNDKSRMIRCIPW